MEKIRLIKKYANRRLYDTQDSLYITLQDIKRYIINHIRFKVIDAKTKQDITRICLIQIILEFEEKEGSPLFSQEALEQMIRFYDNPIKKSFQNYFSHSLNFFTQQQEFIKKFYSQP